MQWLPYAFVRIVLFMATGILVAIYQPDIVSAFAARAALFILCAAYALLVVLRWFSNVRIDAGPVGLGAVMVAGYVLVLARTDSRQADHLLHVSERVQYYRCVVTRAADEREKTWRLEAHVSEVRTTNWNRQSGTVLLYLSKSAYPAPFRYGDVLVVRGAPSLLPPPANPGEFDYRRYQSFRKVYHQHFLRAGDVQHVGHAPPSRLMDAAIRTRLWAGDIIKHNIHGRQERSTVAALVLGVTDGLDNELLSAYAATGAMHILAVSGLHISILYMIIAWLLLPFKRSSKGKWVVAIISVVVLWAYAFVTGLSPSVLRAVAMFTFVALARPWQQRINIYNILAASAFCLLLYEPYFIMSLGFQLSYLAVLGIVYLQPMLYRQWEPSAWLADEVWKVTSVSIAAQIATLPLSLLYFHQFPNYFLLVNLLLIPGSFVVLVGGLALIAFGAITPVATVLGFLLEHLMRLLNAIVFKVGAWPGSVIDNLYVHAAQAWLLSGGIIACLLLIRQRRFYWFLCMVACSLVFGMLQWRHHRSEVAVNAIVFYHVEGHTAVDFLSRGNATVLMDTALEQDARGQAFHLLPNRLMHGAASTVQPAAVTDTVNGARFFVWKGYTLMQLAARPPSTTHIKVNALLLSNNAVFDLGKIVQCVKADVFIVDSSNSARVARRLKEQAARLGVDLVVLRETGALVVEV